MTKTIDGKYYRFVRRNSLPERLLIGARDSIYADFLREMHPAADDRILDVGVSDVINDGANVLERKYPHLHRITACGLGEAPAFREAFPRCDYRQIEPHRPLPFADGAFEIATANAVLEHVGGFDHQRAFIGELCRVSKRAYISVPHRYFPIEHHTSLPFLHYNDLSFRLACRLTGRSEWCEEVNLVLMTRRRLRELTTGIGRRVKIAYTGLRLGPLSSNLYLSIT